MNVAELLVHVSAKQEDENYRRIAAAYEDFETDRVGEISVAPRPLTAQHDGEAEITTRTIAPPVVSSRAPLSSVAVDQTPAPSHAPTSFLFTELSPFFSTAVPQIASTAAVNATPAQDGTDRRKPSEDYISDTPLAVQALESQLWTSSLAAQAYDEGRDHTETEDEFTRSSPLDAPPVVHASERISLGLGGVVDSEPEDETTITMIARHNPDDVDPSQGTKRAFQGATSSQKRRRYNEDWEEGRRQSRRTSLELDELRRREPSSSPLSPSPEPELVPFGNLAAHSQVNDVSKDDTRQSFATPVKQVSSRAISALKPAASSSVKPVFSSVTGQPHQSESRVPNSTHVSRLGVSTPTKLIATQAVPKLPHPTPASSGTIASSVPNKSLDHVNGHSNSPSSHPTTVLARQQTLIKAVARHGAVIQQQIPQIPAASTTVALLPPALPPPHASPITLSISHFTTAPSPPVSLDPGPSHPTTSASSTHITPSLQHLHSKFAAVLPPRYAPLSQSRPLRPLERGYWYMPATSTTALWDMELVKDFWEWLEEFVRSGQAGWSVVLVRVPAYAAAENAVTRADQEDSKEQGLQRDLRIYCWGEVVEHIYYLLFVASRSKVKNAGLKWIDGAGGVVVSMP